MRVYLAGPMRGVPEDNHREFDLAEQRWKEWGHDPVSPAYLARALGKGESGRYTTDARFIRQVMIIDTTVICYCDAVAVLPGWQSSRGATMEVALAQAIDIPIYDAVDGNPLEIQPTPWKNR